MNHKTCFRAGLAVLALWTLAAVAASAAVAPQVVVPTAWTFDSKPLDQVETLALPELDRGWLAVDDIRRDESELPPRFAVPIKVDVTPETHGVWEDVGDGTQVWRYRIEAIDAYSLNLGFTRYRMPEGGQLLIYSPDGGELRGPFTAADNESHGELWTPVLLTDDLVVEVTMPAAFAPKLELRLTQVGHGYRGFGAPGEKSGSCNMDVECLAGNDSWRDTVKASAVISTGGSTFCSGSMLNNTAQDKKPMFMTANHCGINSGNAATLVTYWNYQNTVCRTPGGGASGGPGDGSLAQFNTGSFFRAANPPSDFTLVELDDPINPAFDLYWAGWDHTPYQAPGGPGFGDHACAVTPDPTDPPSAGLCASIHHPSTDEKRITFSETTTATTSYNVPSPPGDGTHVWVHWDSSPPYFASPPGVTEPGSSGSPLYNADHRFIGQLHGGPSACGSTGDNLSDYYGRLSVSWIGGGTAATRASDWLDPANTGVLTLDGRGECTPPAAPANLTATANGANRIDVAWDAVAGAEIYRVFRSAGACPGGAWTLRADNVVTTSYSDLTVLGGVTYAYRVTAVDTGQPCESAPSACDDAVATGSCPAPGVSALVSPVNSTSGWPLRPEFQWTAATLADDYDLEVDDDSDFSSPVYSSTVTGTTHTPTSNLPPGTLLFWRVRAGNFCGNGLYSPVFRFATAIPGEACGGPVTIPNSGNGSPYPSAVTVTSDATSVATIQLKLNGLTHTWPDDIDILLVGPGGQKMVVMSDTGGSGDVSALDVTLDDAAVSLIPDAGPLVAGSYRPSNVDTSDTFPAPAPASPYSQPPPAGAATFASVFGGSNPNGGWNLYLVDDAAGDLGSLTEWCVAFGNADPMPFLDGFEDSNTSAWSLVVP